MPQGVNRRPERMGATRHAVVNEAPPYRAATTCMHACMHAPQNTKDDSDDAFKFFSCTRVNFIQQINRVVVFWGRRKHNNSIAFGWMGAGREMK